MNNLFKTLLITILIMFSNLSPARQLNIASIEYPPYYGEYIDNQGFISVIIKEVWKQNGFPEVKINFLPWKVALAGTISNKYDGLYTAWKSKEREENFYFSDDLVANEVVFFYNKLNPNIPEDFNWKNKNLMEQLAIANVKDYLIPDKIIKYNLYILDTENDTTSFNLLIDGRVDLVLSDKILGQYIIKKNFNKYQNEIKIIGEPLETKMQYYVISKKDPEGIKKMQLFNDGLKKLKASGKFAEIVSTVY